MSTPKKKKVVVTQRDPAPAKKQKSGGPARRRVASRTSTPTPTGGQELIFGRSNYLFLAIGVGLVALGLVLMSGGSMPSKDVWDPDLIYSARRTVLAPLVILAGFGVVIYGIFKS